jgi:hypothetical protein
MMAFKSFPVSVCATIKDILKYCYEHGLPSPSLCGSVEDLDTLEVLEYENVVPESGRNLLYTIAITWRKDERWLSALVTEGKLTLMCSESTGSASATFLVPDDIPYDFIRNYLQTDVNP